MKNFHKSFGNSAKQNKNTLRQLKYSLNKCWRPTLHLQDAILFNQINLKSQRWTEISEQVHMPGTVLDLKGFKVI